MATAQVYAVLLGCLLGLIVCEATYFRRTLHKPVIWTNHQSQTAPSKWKFYVHRNPGTPKTNTGHVRLYHGTVRHQRHGIGSRNIGRVWKKRVTSPKSPFIFLCKHRFGRYNSSNIYHYIKRNSRLLPFVFKNILPKYWQERKTWFILKLLCRCYHHVCNSVVGGVTSTSITSKVRTTSQAPVTSPRVQTTSSTTMTTLISSTPSKGSITKSTETPVKSVRTTKMATTTSYQSTSSATTPTKSFTTPKSPVSSTKKPTTSTETPVKSVRTTKMATTTSYQSTSSATTPTKSFTTPKSPVSSTKKPSTSTSTEPFIPLVPGSV